MNEQAIFLAALDIDDASARTAYLDKACAGNAELRQQVAALLSAHERSGEFLDVPAQEQIAAKESLPADGTIAIEPEHPAKKPVAKQKNPMNTEAESDDDAQDEVSLNFLEPSTRFDSLGRLAQYEVLELLGKGGFGTVVRAFDEKLQRVVAIKIMSPQMAATSPPRKRFLREARSSAKIRHENVVAIHDIQEQPIPYLVMEYIPGETLQQKLDRIGPFDAVETLRIGQQIAAGLAAAHAQSLIHRDIKPANILLESGIVQKVKITDFGLARAADDASLTQSGMIAGTPMYMAPEQAQGVAIDHRADLFSFGSVLYVMCCGRPPFRAATTLAVLKRVAEDAPRPIREIIPEVPQWLCDVVTKLHAKQPEDRFGSAQEVADLLGRYLAEVQLHGKVQQAAGSGHQAAGSGQQAAKSQPAAVTAVMPRPSVKGKRRWLPAAAAGVLLALVGLGWTEATGVTNLLQSTIIRLSTSEGTLIVEVDDPDVSVTIDGEEIVIKGAGPKEIRMKAGQYKVQASKDGKVVRQELVTVAKGGRQVVRISREVEPVVTVGNAPKTEASLAPRYKNTLGMEFALVPKGKSWLGGGGGKPGDKEVEFKDDFYLGVYEVTQEEWEKVTGQTPSHFSRTGPGKDAVKDIPDVDLKRFPVEMVSWDDAQLFLERLNKREKEVGWVYRLPKEAEWEYACRGGPLSDMLDSAFDFYFDKPTKSLLPEQANFANGKGLKRPCKVGSYKPNRLGLYDMHGNVWELCDDVMMAGNESFRVDRGGCWGDGGTTATPRIARRHAPSNRGNYLGLRVARVRVGTSNPDRRAAEWVLSIGGTIGIKENDKEREIKAGGDLPQGAYELTSVPLAHNSKVSDGGLANFQDCKNLTYLDLGATNVSDAGLVHFKDCKNLSVLGLASTQVSDAGLAHFKDCKNLTRLVLHNTQGSDAGMVHFKDCKNLTYLDLGSTQVRDAGLAHLKDCKKLVVLVLGDIPVSDAGLAYFKDCKNLTTLGLNGTKVSDVGLVHLKDCKNLMVLDLRSTQVSDAGLQRLAALAKLGSVNVTKTKVTADGVKKLSAALPLCKIEWDGGRIEPRTAQFMQGNWRIAGDAMEHPEKNQKSLLLFGSADFGDGDFTCEVYRPEEGNGLALVARAADLENYYYFEVGSFNNQFHSIYAKETGKNWRRIDQKKSAPLPTDRWVTIRLKMRGESFEGYVDDQLVLSGKDDQRLKGYLGLRTWNETGKYRNLKFTDAAGKVLWEGLPALPTTTDPDRRAADWVLSIGGAIKIMENGKEREAKAADLPKGPFELTVVSLISNSKVSDAGLAVFKDCKNLTGLDLAGTKVSDAGLVHFKECKNLTSLVLRHAPLSDAGLAHFADCKNLTILDLNDTKVNDAGLAHFKNCKNLTDLRLAGTKVSDAGLAHFEDCKNLTNLDLGSTQVSDAGLVHFKDRKNLTYLVLNGTKVSDAGLAHFKDCKNLTGLHLWGTKVTDAGLAHFKDCKNFTILNLGAPQVSDAGLTHFKDCKNLSRLDVSGTKVSDAGLANLAGCPKLGSLSVHNTKVTEAGVKKLAAALPLCKIEWDGGVIEPTIITADAGKRALALQVLARGGTVHLKNPNEAQLKVEKVNQLPPGALNFIAIFLDGEKVESLGNKVFDGLDLTHAPLFLQVNSATLTDEGLAKLAAIPGIRNVTALELGNGAKLTDAGLLHLAKLSTLKSLTILRAKAVSGTGFSTFKGNLEGLTLGQVGLTREGAAAIGKIPMLKHLNIGSCGLTTAHFEGLAGAKLESLVLANLQLNEAVMKYLSRISGLKELTILNVSLSPQALAGIKMMKNLELLDLKSNPMIMDADVKALAKALPKCKIEWDGGVIEPTPVGGVSPPANKVVADAAIPLLGGHESLIWGVKFLADGRRVVSAGWDGKVRMWDTTTGKQMSEFHTNHQDQLLKGLVVSGDDKYAAAGGSYAGVFLWDLAGGKNPRLLAPKGNLVPVHTVVFSADGLRLLTGLADGTLCVFRIKDGEMLSRTKIFDKASIFAMRLHPDGERIVISSYGEPKALLWDLAKGKAVVTYPSAAAVESVALDREGRRVFLGTTTGKIIIADVATGAVQGELEGHGGTVRSVHVLPGDRLATSSEDKTIRLWDLAARKEIHRFTADDYVVNISDVSPDGRRLVAGAGWRVFLFMERFKDMRLRQFELRPN